MHKTQQLKLTLYTTSACHLCEQAAQLLQQLDMEAVAIEIAEDEQLLHRYATRIPVLCHPHSGVELGWPFDAAQVQQWVALLQ